MNARPAWALVFLLGAAFATAAAAQPSAQRVVTYSIESRGEVGGDIPAFAATVADAFSDPRGWSLGGAIEFRRVDSGGALVLWLASPDALPSFASACSPDYSCRVGPNVVVNDQRFRDGSPEWTGSLSDYRLQVVNHETGHWIGFDHDSCGGAGEAAPVMMQQSKGAGECFDNPWPLEAERLAAARLLHVGIPAALAVAKPPQARVFIAVP